jgi:predicted nuclease of predicted toxin-antitoxin system
MIIWLLIILTRRVGAMAQSQSNFKILADVHIPAAVVEQLRKRGVTIETVPDLLGQDTPDPDILEYANQHGYTVLTHDKKMQKHVNDRVATGKEHCGVFIGGDHLQGDKGIGKIVANVVFMQEAIAGEAATLQDEVYNQIKWIK